jgi:hypothetical protein
LIPRDRHGRTWLCGHLTPLHHPLACGLPTVFSSSGEGVGAVPAGRDIPEAMLSLRMLSAASRQTELPAEPVDAVG